MLKKEKDISETVLICWSLNKLVWSWNVLGPCPPLDKSVPCMMERAVERHRPGSSSWFCYFLAV